MSENTKLTDFNTYCPKCLHWTKLAFDDPCDECLSYPAREGTRKPIYYQPKDSQEKQTTV